MLYKISKIPKCVLAWIREKGAHLMGVGKQANEVCSKQLGVQSQMPLRSLYDSWLNLNEDLSRECQSGSAITEFRAR